MFIGLPLKQPIRMISDGINFQLVDKVPLIILFSMILSHMMSVKLGCMGGFGPCDFKFSSVCLSQLNILLVRLKINFFFFSYSNYTLRDCESFRKGFMFPGKSYPRAVQSQNNKGDAERPIILDYEIKKLCVLFLFPRRL